MCRWQVKVYVYCARRIPARLRCTECSVAPYRYVLPNIYLSVTDIANSDLLRCCCRSWISLDIVRFYEEQCQPSSGSAWQACPKTVNRASLLGEGGVDRICTAACQTIIVLSIQY